MAGRPFLALLKEQVGASYGAKNFGHLVSELYPQGVPKGAILELTGNAKILFLVKLLKDNPNTRVLWLERKLTVFPTGLF